ncbi:MAG: UbiA family prenyltransferase [Candidatus Moranbacteria bacterium]|nr:UbiA family prenyltransferase [Candidatus Moranbacteria bacterium]
MKKLAEFIETILEKKVEPIFWCLTFFGIIEVRLYLDKFIAKSSSPLFDLVVDIHNLLFFFLTIALVWLILCGVLKKNPFELASFMLWVALAIIFPPIFDLLKTGSEVFWSFYLISAPSDLIWQYGTIFGHLPSGVVYFGTKIVFVIGVILLTGLVYIKTKKFSKTIFTAIGTYSALFLMAAFPSLFYYFVRVILGKAVFSVYAFEVIQFFAKSRIFGIELAPVFALPYNLNLIYFPLCLVILGYFFWKSEPKMFRAAVHNFRYPQVIFHTGLLFLGLGVGFWEYQENFELNLFSLSAVFCVLLSVLLAWEASVVVNDILDYQVDAVSNPERPLQKGIFTTSQYAQFGAIMFFLSIVGAGMVNYKFGILLFIYQVLAWFYSAEPFRLKRFVPIASILSAVTLLTVFFSGFIFFSPEQNLERLSWRIIFLLLITYTVSLPIKDFKDIEGDKKDGVRTIPVIFGEEKGHLIVASGIFLSYVLSVFFINEFRLFWWAILFGSLSFLVVTNKKIHPRRVFWWILPLVTIYGLIAVKVVFELTF